MSFIVSIGPIHDSEGQIEIITFDGRVRDGLVCWSIAVKNLKKPLDVPGGFFLYFRMEKGCRGMDMCFKSRDVVQKYFSFWVR